MLDAVKKLASTRSVKFMGLHAHIGSQIFDAKGYLDEITVLLTLMKEINEKLKIDVDELNIGGGIGIAYTAGDDPVDLEAFAESITKHLKTKLAELKLPQPKLILEPGRSIVGRAGITLYTVGTVKEIPAVRKYVIVDGGMSDNIRPMLYDAKYDFAAADDMNAPKDDKVTIAGKFCESGDVLGKDVDLQKVKKGSVVASLCTGAYNYSMASNYNRVGRPAMVMVSGGIARIIVKRESYEDMTKNDAV